MFPQKIVFTISAAETGSAAVLVLSPVTIVSASLRLLRQWPQPIESSGMLAGLVEAGR